MDQDENHSLHGVLLRIPYDLATRIEAYAREEGLAWDVAALELIGMCLYAVSRATIIPAWYRKWIE